MDQPQDDRNVVAAIGSCFAVSIAKTLEEAFGWRRNAMLAQTRSDVFIETAIKREWTHPTISALDEFAVRNGNPGRLEINKRRLKPQSRERFSLFLAQLRTSDLIIIDNHYDITSTIFLGDESMDAGVKLKFQPAPHYAKNRLPPIDASRSNENFLQIIRWLRSYVPQATIMFAPVPKSTRRKHLRRHDVFKADQDALGTPELPENSFVVPKLDLRKELHNDKKGFFYFVPEVYSTYAKAMLDFRAAPGATNPGRAIKEALSGREPAKKSAFPAEHSAFSMESEEGYSKGEHPYDRLPSRSYWRPAIGTRSALEISDLYRKRFDIPPNAKIATCGSCFAQHIGIRMKAAGFNYMDVEPAPPELPRNIVTDRGYGIYSARYGNVYTARQLKQLFLRAFEKFRPVEDEWEENGHFYDPFRPTIEPDGFQTKQQLVEEREKHFAAVRRLFQEVNTFVFTFGLTEAWMNRDDGAVYPLCLGTAHGVFNPDMHVFKNFNVEEVYADFAEFMDLVRQVNKNVSYLVTVSPIPLVATASGQHVLVATMHSKSILRAACSLLLERHENVDYFPSYEIIASHPFRAMFYDANLRTVSGSGVDHVMRQFFAQHDGDDAGWKEEEDDIDFEEKCDEILLDKADD